MIEQVRWRRVVQVTLAAAVMAGAVAYAPFALDAWSAHQERVAAEPHPIPADDAQQRAIVAALMTRYESDQPLLLVDRTARLCPDPLPEEHGGTLDCIDADSLTTPDEIGVPYRLRRELHLANLNTQPQPDPGIAHVAMIEQREFDRVLAEGQAGWNGLFARHPGAQGMEVVSRAVLSKDGRHAAILVKYACGWLCSSGSLDYLRRDHGVWRVEADLLLWTS